MILNIQTALSCPAGQNLLIYETFRDLESPEAKIAKHGPKMVKNFPLHFPNIRYSEDMSPTPRVIIFQSFWALADLEAKQGKKGSNMAQIWPYLNN